MIKINSFLKWFIYLKIFLIALVVNILFYLFAKYFFALLFMYIYAPKVFLHFFLIAISLFILWCISTFLSAKFLEKKQISLISLIIIIISFCSINYLICQYPPINKFINNTNMKLKNSKISRQIHSKEYKSIKVNGF